MHGKNLMSGGATTPSALRIHCPAGVIGIDAGAREIWRDEQLVSLAPPVFDCIAYLIAHRERAVGRDELISAVWGREAISDTVLHQTVMKARRVFGDSGEEQQVLRTIPRFGYRWIAAVESESVPAATTSMPAPSSAAPQPAASGRTDVRRWRWALLTIVALLLLVGGALLAWWYVSRVTPVSVREPAAEAVASDAVVVLPVEVSDGDDTAWIPLGVMDAISSYLRDGDLAVVPSQTVIGVIRDAGDTPMAPVAWQRSTGAGRIVRSSAVRNASSWQVILTLYGADGVIAQSQGEAKEVLEAARVASGNLLATLHPERTPSIAPVDGDAAATQLLGRVRAEVLANRIDVAHQLIEAAPDDVRSRPEVRLQQAEIDYRAGRLDEARAAFHELLGVLSAESEPVLRARAMLALGSIDRTVARFDDAERRYEQAIALLAPLHDPLWLGRAHMLRGVALGSLRKFDAARREIARGRVLLVGTGDAYSVAQADSALATLDADRGRLDAAAPALARVIERLERLGARGEALDLRIGLAHMDTELLQHRAALDQAGRVWQSIEAEPAQRLYVMAAALYARALGDVGRLSDAQHILDLIDSGSHAHDYQWRFARSVAARQALRGGDAERAERLAGDVAGENDMVDHADIGPVLLTWTRALRTQANPGAMTTALERVGTWAARWQDDPSGPRIYAALMRAEQAWSERDIAGSRREYAEALSHAATLGVPLHTAQVVHSYGNALIADGALDEAASVIGQLARHVDTDFDSAVLSARLHQALHQRDAWQHALKRVRELAGERPVPAEITQFDLATPSL